MAGAPPGWEEAEGMKAWAAGCAECVRGEGPAGGSLDWEAR